MAHIINRPNALYYNGELIGIITNVDPYGRIDDIVNKLNNHEKLCEARSMHVSSDLVEAIRPLPEVIPVDDGAYVPYEQCTNSGGHLTFCDDDGYCNNCGEQ